MQKENVIEVHVTLNGVEKVDPEYHFKINYAEGLEFKFMKTRFGIDAREHFTQ